MDDERFDDLSRRLATSRTRREVLVGLGAAVTALFAGRATSAAPKKDKPPKPDKCYGGGSHCTNGKQCCSSICTNRQCEPELAPECVTAADCPGIDTDCQMRTCWDGICGMESLAAGMGCAGGVGVCDGSGGCVECLTGDDCASGICDNGACTASCLTDSNLGAVCTVGVGACERTGELTCATDGVTLVCNAEPGQGSTEVCNGIDDDCDGFVDEGAICPPRPNADSTCLDGECVLTCAPEYADCNGNSADGCETLIYGNDGSNCGGCGIVCPLQGTVAGDSLGQICYGGACVCLGDGDCPSGTFCETQSSTGAGLCR